MGKFEPTAESIVRLIRYRIDMFKEMIRKHEEYGIGANLEHIAEVQVLSNLLRDIERAEHPELDPRSRARKAWDAFTDAAAEIFSGPQEKAR